MTEGEMQQMILERLEALELRLQTLENIVVGMIQK